MAARDMKSADEVKVVNIPQVPSEAQPATVNTAPVTSPGRKLSFEEAVIATTEQYDEALRGLAQ